MNNARQCPSRLIHLLLQKQGTPAANVNSVLFIAANNLLGYNHTCLQSQNYYTFDGDGKVWDKL